MLPWILLTIGLLCLIFGKAVADTVAHKDLWDKSIFSRWSETSFLGPKDKTWIRKYRYKNAILKYLFSTILVATTDLWHLANTVTRVGIYLSVYAGILLSYDHALLVVTVFAIWNTLGFHIVYTYLLKK